MPKYTADMMHRNPRLNQSCTTILLLLACPLLDPELLLLLVFLELLGDAMPLLIYHGDRPASNDPGVAFMLYDPGLTLLPLVYVHPPLPREIRDGVLFGVPFSPVVTYWGSVPWSSWRCGSSDTKNAPVLSCKQRVGR